MARTSRPRILLVDDDDLVRELACEVLRAECDVVAVESAEAALAELASDPIPFDLVCTDFAMPGMNGGALVTRIASERPGLTCVILTGSDTPGARKCREAFGVIDKPFRPSQLAELVRHLVAGDFASAKGVIESWESRHSGRRVA